MQDAPIAPDPSRRGAAMITTSVLIVVIGATAAVLSTVTVSRYEQQIARRDQVTLMLSAESAANMAHQYFQNNYKALTAGALGSVGGTVTVPLGTTTINGHALSAELETLVVGAEPEDSRYRITGTAQALEDSNPNRVRHRVESVVFPVPAKFFKQSMLGIQGYDFTGSASTDSWNSTEGGYTGASTGNGDLASEGTIDVTGSGSVDGTVTSDQEFPLPEFDYSDQLASRGNPASSGTLSSDITWTEAGSPYRYDSISLNNKTVTVDKGNIEVFVDGQVTFQGTDFVYPDDIGTTTAAVGASSTLRFADGTIAASTTPVALGDTLVIRGTGPNSGAEVTVAAFNDIVDGMPDTITVNESIADDSGAGGESVDFFSRLTIYQDDYVGSDSEFKFNGTTSVGDIDGTAIYPSNLLFFTEYDGKIKMNGGADFAGLLFAPYATVQFNGNFDFYGSVVAKAFDTKVGGVDDQGKVNGSFSFHYDDSLADLSVDFTPQLVVFGWRSWTMTINE